MKKMLLFVAAVAILAACSKKEAGDNTIDKWNGYSNLKDGELVRTLWAGQHDSAGYVTYGIDEDANFYATFTTVDGWEMSETHLFAGDKGDMPVNKPGNPKIGKFPYKDSFNPPVTEVTYTIELIQLPQAEVDGFVAAAHAVVQGPNGQETAWGFGDYSFTDKGWGWYTTYWYQQDQNLFTILYSMEYVDGKLLLFEYDATNNRLNTTYEEVIDLGEGVTIDGFAYDPISTNLFFATSTQELRALKIESEETSILVGMLEGSTTSATFYEGKYYYVDNADNNIKEVTFTNGETLSILNENIYSTIPSSIAVNDIAFEPTGDNVYIIGVYNTNVELIGLEVLTDTYSTIALDESIGNDAQIAYGDDEILYMVSGSILGGGIASTLSPETGVSVPIEQDSVIIVDPFGDMAGGPLK